MIQNKMSPEMGIVERIAGPTLAYLRSLENGKSYSFGPTAIKNYSSNSFAQDGLTIDTKVSFTIDPESGFVVEVCVIQNRVHARSLESSLEFPDYMGFRDTSTTAQQIELDPDSEPIRSVKPNGAIAPRTRAFGKCVDTSTLRAGDLLLSRPVTPGDFVSATITEVQIKGGYAPNDSRWTHAAMYLGDKTNVVEASFDTMLGGGDVRITNLNDYATGEYYLRFRRSKAIQNEYMGWLLCVRGLAQLKKPYDFILAAKMWFNIIIKKGGFFDDKKMAATSNAVVCSTFYADAHNEATRECLGEINGSCVPAWLSLSCKLTDVKADWLQIES